MIVALIALQNLVKSLVQVGPEPVHRPVVADLPYDVCDIMKIWFDHVLVCLSNEIRY